MGCCASTRARPTCETVFGWGCSSVGRAPRSQRGGRRFDPDHLHHLFAYRRARPSATRTCEPRQDRKVAAVSKPPGVPLAPWPFNFSRRPGSPMAPRALTLKYRPQVFADLVGQDHVTSVLTAALESGRVAQAFLFTGARGVGKTTSARILAKALNCQNRGSSALASAAGG